MNIRRARNQLLVLEWDRHNIQCYLNGEKIDCVLFKCMETRIIRCLLFVGTLENIDRPKGILRVHMVTHIITIFFNFFG